MRADMNKGINTGMDGDDYSDSVTDKSKTSIKNYMETVGKYT